MQATVENGALVLRIPMNPVPVPSLSGKTLVVASSHGNNTKSATVDGKPIVVGVNAYLRR